MIIIAGSLPTLPPLFQQCLHTYRSYIRPKGYHSYDDAIELQRHRAKHAIGSMPIPLGRIDRGGSDQDILATDTGGITKTVDFTLAALGSAERKPESGERNAWENWDSEDSVKRRVEGDEIV